MLKLLTALLLIFNFAYGDDSQISIDQFRAKIENEFKELGFYQRDLVDEQIYQSQLKKIEYDERVWPDSPLTKVMRETFERTEKYRIKRITSSILENRYFKIKDELKNNTNIDDIKLLKKKLIEAKKTYTLYTFGKEYELSECWENRNCPVYSYDWDKNETPVFPNVIFVEPPEVNIIIVE